MLRSDMPEAPSHPAPPSQSLLLSEKVNSTKEVASKPIHAADHIVDLSPPTYDFSRPAPYGCAATELGTEDTHEGTLKTSVKDLPVNLPFSVKGWKARVPEAEPRTDTVDRPTDIVPSSPAAAPSVADRSLKPYAKNLKRPSNLDDPQGQKLDRQLVSPGNIEARQQPLKGNVSSTLREITKTSSKENLPHSSELSPGSPHISKSEAQRSKDQASMTGLTIIESPCATTRPSQSKIISAKIPEAVEFSPPSGEKSSGESGQPIKKLCSQCHKPILGSTLMCMRCRQTKNDHSSTEGRKDSHLSVICSPKTPVAVPSQVICSTTLNEESPAEESNLGHRRARNVLSRRDYVQESPFIPETPELASGKESERLFIAVDDKVSSPANSRKLPGQLVPQKRPAAHSLLGNEHCFTKKKLNRMFKPTTAFVGANEPGLNLNKLSHGPVSSLSCIENNSQDASVQTRVETVDRGTSPRSNSSEVHDRSHSPTRRVDSPCNGPSEATSHKREISSGNDAPHKSPSFRPYSAIRSKQQRLWKTDRKFLKQPAKGAAQKAQEFKPDELAIAHFQQAMQHDHKSLRPSSAAREKGPYSPKHDREKENQSDINPNDGPDETAYNWTSRDEQALLSKLRKKGVMFEDDSSSETELTVQPSPSKPPPKDPLWCRPKSSTDLFAIAPHLRPGHSTFDIEQKRKEIAARPSRKQRRQNMSYLRQERGQRIHEEVQRIFLPRMVKVRTVENADFANLVDDGANETRHEHRSEKEMTFSEFIGAPAKPMVILTKDKQLAFRDGTRDMKGDLPRAREKFTVTNKSVACMEH